MTEPSCSSSCLSALLFLSAKVAVLACVSSHALLGSFYPGALHTALSGGACAAKRRLATPDALCFDWAFSCFSFLLSSFRELRLKAIVSDCCCTFGLDRSDLTPDSYQVSLPHSLFLYPTAFAQCRATYSFHVTTSFAVRIVNACQGT